MDDPNMHAYEDSLTPLLLCPFCGSTKLTLENLGEGDDWFVHCDGCEVQQIANYQKAIAVERWNNRARASVVEAPKEAAPDTVESLKEQLAQEKARHCIGGDIFETERNRLILQQQMELSYLLQIEALETKLARAASSAPQTTPDAATLDINDQLQAVLGQLNRELEHAVSCMNRSCPQCSEIMRRFGPAQEGVEGLSQQVATSAGDRETKENKNE
jgi:Lar family restriction alleviation protein